MIISALYSFFFFAAGMFAVLNGPLWLSVRVGVFAGSRQAPFWLNQGVSWLSRLLGFAILATWAWITMVDLMPTLLMCAAMAASLVCLLELPWNFITSANIFKRGQEVPPWAENATFWFIRLVGVVGLLGALVIGIITVVT